MYTVVQKPDIPGHRKRADRPALEVIDHRKKGRETKFDLEESYEKLRKQREALMEAEIKYQKRIKELEKDAAELAKAQEVTNTENKSLKNFLQRGPKASNVKKVKQQNSELQDVIKKLHEENKDLVQLINRMEKRDEDEWKNVFEETRKRQEERYSVVGPFVAGLNGKKATITLQDLPDKTVQDDYDRQLNKLSKETKNLLHKFEQMKRNKGSIDYATVMGPKFCGTNINKHRAIGDRVNMDLNKYSARLEDLTTRHEKMTESLISSMSSTPKRKTKKAKKDDVESGDGKEGKSADTPSHNGKQTKDAKTTGKGSKTHKRRTPSNSASTFMTEVPSEIDKVNETSPIVDTENSKTEKASTDRKKASQKKTRQTLSKAKTVQEEAMNSEQEDETRKLKPTSSTTSKGILKGKDITRKDEKVKFDTEIEINDESPDRVKPSTPKTKLEENWDMQREKMKGAQSIKPKRSAAKSASTVRKKAAQPIKIKSELDNYKDEDTQFIRREGNRRPSIKDSDKSTASNSPTKSRSPLVYQNALKQGSANDVGSKIFGEREEGPKNRRPKEAFVATKRNPNAKSEDVDDAPNSTGRYTHGPEPLNSTNKTLAFISGPDPKQSKSTKINSGTTHRTAAFSSVGTKGANIDSRKVEPLQLENQSKDRRDSKTSVPTRNFDPITEPRSAKSSAKSPRTFPKHPPIHKNSIHLEKAPNSKTLLKYLKKNTGGSPLDFEDRFTDQESKQPTPVPLPFRNDARTLKQQNIRFVSRDELIRPEIDERRGDYYRSYLTAS